MRNEFFLFLSPLYGILLQLPEWTKTETLDSLLFFPADILFVINFSRCYCRSVTWPCSFSLLPLSKPCFRSSSDLGRAASESISSCPQHSSLSLPTCHWHAAPESRAGHLALLLDNCSWPPSVSMAPLALAFTALPIVFPSGCFSLSSVTLGTLAVSQGLFTVPQRSLPFPTLILLFRMFWFLGMHTCACLSGRLLPIHVGEASLLPSPWEHPPCCSPSPGSKHVPGTLFSQEFVHTCLMSLTTLCLFSSMVEAQEQGHYPFWEISSS